MFKKEIKIIESREQTLKERKNFKQQLHEKFDKESIDQLFFNVDLFYIQKAEKGKSIFYASQKNVLFIDSTGKNDVFPTIYCANLIPNIIPFKFILNDEYTSEKFKKKQLFQKDFKNFLDVQNYQEDDLALIQTGNGKIIAVGAITKTYDSEEKNDDNEDPLIITLNMINDFISKLGIQELPDSIYPINEQKGNNIIKEEQEQQNNQEEDADDNLLQFYQKVTSKNNNVTKTNIEKVDKKNHQILKKQNNKKEEKEEKQEKQQHGQNLKKGKKKKIEQSQDVGNPNDQKQMDNYILEAFKNAVIISVTDDELPMDYQNFWTKHMIPSQNPEAKIDIKQSSYLKYGKLFAFLEKQNYITNKENTKKGSQGQSMNIQKINRMHAQLQNWEPTITKIQQSNDAKEDENQKDDNKNIKAIFLIENFFELTNIISQYIEKFKNNNQQTHEAIQKEFKNYFKQKKMMNKNDVVFDQQFIDDFQLHDFLTDNEGVDDTEEADMTKKKNVKLQFDKFIDHVLQMCKPMHIKKNIQTQQKEILIGKFSGLQIVSGKQHSKIQTKISNLNFYGVNIENFKNYLNEKLQITPLIENNFVDGHHRKDIILDGNLVDEVKEIIIKDCEIPESQIQSIVKIEKKVKKMMNRH